MLIFNKKKVHDDHLAPWKEIVKNEDPFKTFSLDHISELIQITLC